MLRGEIQGECGVCRKAITAEFPGVVMCTKCRALYHPDCWGFNGDKCAVYGCGAVPREAGATPAPPPVSSTPCAHHPQILARGACVVCRIPLCGECSWTRRGQQDRYCDTCVPRKCVVCSGDDHFVKDCGCMWLVLVGGGIGLIVWAWQAIFGK